MTLVRRKKKSSVSKPKRIKKMFRHGFTGIGVFAVATLIVLASNTTLCNKAANALSQWASQSPAIQQPLELTLAPFNFEEPETIENTIPSGTSKLSLTAIENLPILDLSELTPQQIRVTDWIANRYRVAPEMVALLVQEAWNIGDQKRLDPTLILAIVAIESRFNPYAQSQVGATGLMQVMTNIHSAKFERTGGAVTVFDPVTNMRVGVQVLEEHVRRAGSLEGGLKQYVGATGPTDNGYGAKVLAERDRLRRVILGNQSYSLDSILSAGRPAVQST